VETQQVKASASNSLFVCLFVYLFVYRFLSFLFFATLFLIFLSFTLKPLHKLNLTELFDVDILAILEHTNVTLSIMSALLWDRYDRLFI